MFEVEGLCIGHLGHLHNEPKDEQYEELGRLDFVTATIDSGQAVPVQAIARCVRRLWSSIVIPMHWFGRGALDQFLVEMSDGSDTVRNSETSIEVSLRTNVVLEPQFLE